MEDIAPFGQCLFDRFVVLYDSVMYDGQISRIGELGVGVHIVGYSVGGQSSMANAQLSFQGDVDLGSLLQVLHLPFGLGKMGVLPIVQGDSRTVISTVFQPLQALDDYGIGFPMADITNYSTHKIDFWFISIIG